MPFSSPPLGTSASSSCFILSKQSTKTCLYKTRQPPSLSSSSSFSPHHPSYLEFCDRTEDHSPSLSLIVVVFVACFCLLYCLIRPGPIPAPLLFTSFTHSNSISTQHISIRSLHTLKACFVFGPHHERGHGCFLGRLHHNRHNRQ